MYLYVFKYIVLAVAVFLFINYGLKKSMDQNKKIYLSLIVVALAIILDNLNFSKHRFLEERFANYQRSNPSTVYSKDLIQLVSDDKYFTRSTNTSQVMMVKPTTEILSTLSKLRLFKEGKDDQLNAVKFGEDIQIQHNSIADRVGASVYKNMAFVIGYGADNKLLSHENMNISRKYFVLEDAANSQNKGEVKYDSEVVIRISGSDSNTYFQINEDGSLTANGTRAQALKMKISMMEPAMIDDTHLSVRLNEYIF